MMFIGTWLYLFSTFHVTENFIWLSELKKVWKKRLKKKFKEIDGVDNQRNDWQVIGQFIIDGFHQKQGKRISQYLESHASISHLWEHRKIICQHVTKSHVNCLRAVQYNRTLNQIYDGVLKSSQCMFSLLKDYTLQHFTHRPITMCLIWALFFFFFSRSNFKEMMEDCLI